MTLTHTLASGTVVHLVDSGCDTSPQAHFVWLGQCGPEFAVVLGDSEDEAHEYFFDALGTYVGLTNEDIYQLHKECMADGADEDKAYEEVTVGMLPINGGERWVDCDDWGFWTPSKGERKELIDAVTKLRKGEEKHT
jgi:hypothetical protein